MGKRDHIWYRLQRGRQDPFDNFDLRLPVCAFTWLIRSNGFQKVMVSFATDGNFESSCYNELLLELHVFENDLESIFVAPNVFLTDRDFESDGLRVGEGSACTHNPCGEAGNSQVII